MKNLLALLSLLILISCQGNSKAEGLLNKTCFDTTKAFMSGLKKPFDEAKTRTHCECAAPIMAKRCGTNCETEEGVAMFMFAITEDLNKEVDEKCKKI